MVFELHGVDINWVSPPASPGLPLISPDVCPPPVPSQSSRSLLPCPSQAPQPQAPPQAALLPTPQQHPMGNHMMAQVRASQPPCLQRTTDELNDVVSDFETT